MRSNAPFACRLSNDTTFVLVTIRTFGLAELSGLTFTVWVGPNETELFFFTIYCIFQDGYIWYFNLDLWKLNYIFNPQGPRT